ncbi:MAG: c-type cytochrome [Dehalococcoidia bacterium]|nr:c-type cytochrome [Dehalococcoidia bacterium]
MNTSKQVNIMIGVLGLSVLMFGAYMLNEGNRQAEARTEITERVAERGARLFVNNCRNCHGMEGEGHVGPPLNVKAFLILGEENQYGALPTSQGEVELVHNFLFNTISCGRTGTFMPTWAQRFGGSLSDTQVKQLVTMITEGRWDLVKEIGAEHDYAQFKDTYKGALPGLSEHARIARIAAGEVPADVKEKVSKQILEQTPALLSAVTRNCGQFTSETGADVRNRDPLSATPPPTVASPTQAPSGGGDGGGGAAAGALGAELSEFKLVVAAERAPAGDVSFRVQNKGQVAHNFYIIKSDLAIAQLPVSGGRVNEGAVQVVAKSADLAAGRSANVGGNLQAGKYVLICNVPAHYQSGMRVGFTVE